VDAVAAAGQVAGSCWVVVLGLDYVGEGDEGEAVDVAWVQGAVAACAFFFCVSRMWEEAGGGCVEGGMFGSVGSLVDEGGREVGVERGYVGGAGRGERGSCRLVRCCGDDLDVVGVEVRAGDCFG
jgi:hypothetical protein